MIFSTTAAKHEGKKQSKNKSGKKEKELRRRDARLEELKLRLQSKIEEIKGIFIYLYILIDL